MPDTKHHQERSLFVANKDGKVFVRQKFKEEEFQDHPSQIKQNREVTTQTNRRRTAKITREKPN